MNDTIYTLLTEDDKIESNPTRVTSPVWSTNTGILTDMFILNSVTGSLPIGDSQYYFNVYSTNPNNVQNIPRPEFSIAYGNIYGSGSIQNELFPTKAVYCQFRNLLLNNPNGLFSYPSGSSNKTITHFFAISINRAGFKQRIDPGNWQLNISGSALLKLIDDSNESTDSIISNKSVFNVVSGSIAEGRSGQRTYGLFYPDYGIIILDADTLAANDSNGGISLNVNTSSNSWTNSNNKTNLKEFFDTILNGAYFAMRSEEIINSSHYFIRVKNKNYNYSSNPTFYSGSNGIVRFNQFAENPNVFITTIGLYDDNNDLLAVAKLSEPILKSFEREALIKVRLDF